MIKNRTYYLGKPFLKIERYPEYIGESKLNKVHFDFRLFKLVSRVSTEKYNEELLIDVAHDQLCSLMSYDINRDTGDIEYHNFNQNLTPCFVKDGVWLGLDEVFMCYNNSMLIEDHGLARIYGSDIFNADIHLGYYGYSHRGGQSFRICDMIFDPEWKMNEFHSEYKKYKKDLNKSKYATRIEDVVPYSKRGNVVIETLEQAKQAATNISKYLS